MPATNVVAVAAGPVVEHLGGGRPGERGHRREVLAAAGAVGVASSSDPSPKRPISSATMPFTPAPVGVDAGLVDGVGAGEEVGDRVGPGGEGDG